MRERRGGEEGEAAEERFGLNFFPFHGQMQQALDF